MPVYTYRRDDGTTFDFRQKFSDDPLEFDPETGQRVKRVVQAAGVIFKGSGFYVNDSKSASRSSVNNTASHSSDSKAEKSEKPESNESADKKAQKAEKAVESKASTEAPAASKPAAKPQASAAAD